MRLNVSDIDKLTSPSSMFDTALAGTRQGWYERACERGLDGFRSNAEEIWDEGEGSAFDGALPRVLSCLTPEFVGRVLTITLYCLSSVHCLSSAGIRSGHKI
jgi:hypothetical protein